MEPAHTDSGSAGGRRRFGRPLRIAVVALLLVEVAYVAGANYFLNSDWGRSTLNRRPHKLTLEWRRAWTVIPGLVHVSELALAGGARRANWRASGARAHLLIWLPSLARRHLRFLVAGARGASVEVDPLPPPTTPRPQRRRRGWRISLGHMDLDEVGMLRFGDSILVGDGRVRGSARFEVRGPMAFDLSELSFHRAQLRVGDDLAADALTLDSELDIDEVTMGEATVLDLLAGTSGSIELEAEASSLGFLTSYLERFPWIEIGGAGHLEVDLELSDGWLAPESFFHFDGPRVSASYLGLEAVGAGRVRGEVPAGAGHLRIAAEFEDYSVAGRSGGSVLLAGEALSVVVTNDSTAIDRPADGVAVAIRLPPATVPDLAALDPYVPESVGVALSGGNAELSAQVDYSASSREGEGWLLLQGRRILADFEAASVVADFELQARFPAIDLEAGTLALDGTQLSIENVTAAAEGEAAETEAWWGRLTVPTGMLVRPPAAANAGGVAVADQPPGAATVSGTLAAQLLDTAPLTALLQDKVPRLSWFDQLLTVERVDLRSQFTLAGADVRFDELVISGGEKGRLEIQAELDLRGRELDGVLLAAWGPLSAAVALEEGERDWKLTRSRRWYEQQAANYRGRQSVPTP